MLAALPLIVRDIACGYFELWTCETRFVITFLEVFAVLSLSHTRDSKAHAPSFQEVANAVHSVIAGLAVHQKTTMEGVSH